MASLDSLSFSSAFASLGKRPTRDSPRSTDRTKRPRVCPPDLAPVQERKIEYRVLHHSRTDSKLQALRKRTPARNTRLLSMSRPGALERIGSPGSGCESARVQRRS